MFDNRKAPHVHNKSVMCNFIFIQSILLSHCELNTFFFFLQRLPHFSHHKRETVGDKGGFSFNKLCFSAACEKSMWFLRCGILIRMNSALQQTRIPTLFYSKLGICVNVGGNPGNWVILVLGACWDIKQSNPPLPVSLSRCRVSVYKLFLHLSLPGSFTGSGSTEAGSITTTTTDSVDQVSPTMPRATKNRVSGKLRRSASAISKSSNWALQPIPLFPLPECRLQSFLEKPHKLSRDCKKLLWCFVFFFRFCDI